MYPIFIGLILALAAVPSFTLCWYLYAAIQSRKASRPKPTTVTTMRTGPNGRTVFETKKPRAQSLVLPFTTQQASQADRRSVKGAWQRLSRPFSMAAAPEISPVTSKPMPKIPTNYCARDLAISPSTPKTMAEMTQSPVSPLSISNIPASSSITGRIISSCQQADPAKTFDNIPLTPPRSVQNGKQVPYIPFENPRQPPIPLAKLNTGSIKLNVVDASHQYVPILKLAQPPVKRGWI